MVLLMMRGAGWSDVDTRRLAVVLYSPFFGIDPTMFVYSLTRHRFRDVWLECVSEIDAQKDFSEIYQCGPSSLSTVNSRRQDAVETVSIGGARLT
jgi:hypothetical protein